MKLAALLSTTIFASVALAGTPIATPAERPVDRINDAAVASDGESFFAVWRDEFFDTLGGIFRENGESSDEFPVVATWKEDWLPATVWNGSEYVTLVTVASLGVFAVGVSPEGEVRGISIPMPAEVAEQPRLAWNGSRYAYAGIRSTDNVLLLHLLDPSLQLVKTVPLTEPGLAVHADVATDGSRFLVTWTEKAGDNREIGVQVFDSSGDAVAPRRTIDQRASTQPPPGYFSDVAPAVAWNGTSYLIAWSNGPVRAVTVSANGVPGSPETIASVPGARFVSIGWDGLAHLITWTEQTGEIGEHGAFVERQAAAFTTSTGELIRAMPMPMIEGLPARAAMASNGDVYFVVWGGERLVIRSAGEPALVSHVEWTYEALQNQRAVSLAAGEESLLAAWQEGRSVYAGRLSFEGAALDGAGLLLSEDEPWVEPDPVVASNDGVWLVTWQGNGLMASRITKDGEVIDPIPNLIEPTSSGSVAVAAGVDEFRIAATLSVNPVTGGWWRKAIFTKSIPLRGPVTSGENVPLFPSDLSQDVEALFVNDDGYTLVWTQATTPPCAFASCMPAESELRASHLDRSGETLATHTIGVNVEPIDVIATRDGEIRVFYWEDGFRIMRLQKDGQPMTKPPVRPGQWWSPHTIGSVIETGDGFLLFNSSEIHRLDSDGLSLGPPIRGVAGPDSAIEDMAFDGRRTWIAYAQPLKVRPKAHDLAISRAYVQEFQLRRRAVGR